MGRLGSGPTIVGRIGSWVRVVSVFNKNSRRVLSYHVLRQQKTGLWLRGLCPEGGWPLSPAYRAYNVEPVTKTSSSSWRTTDDGRHRDARECSARRACWKCSFWRSSGHWQTCRNLIRGVYPPQKKTTSGAIPPNTGPGDGSPPAGSTPVRVWGKKPPEARKMRFMAFKNTLMVYKFTSVFTSHLLKAWLQRFANFTNIYKPGRETCVISFLLISAFVANKRIFIAAII